MAESPSQSEKDAGEPQPASGAAPEQQQRVRVEINDSNVSAIYANFCRVTGSPEEMILDFGLNPQPFGVPTEPIVVTHRIITNFYTAKRLLHTLQMAIQRHEATFGVLEIDVQKRLMPGMMPPPQPRQPSAGP